MTEEKYSLKIKKIEKKQVWAEDIDGVELWTMELVDPITGLPKMKITTEERIEGFNQKDKVKVVIKNEQVTLPK